MPYRILGGAFEGATKGLTAGLRYPKTVYSNLYNHKSQYDQYYDLSRQLSRFEYHTPQVLAQTEMIIYENHLNCIQDTTEKEKLRSEYDEYKKYLQQTCPFTGKNITKIRQSLNIETVSGANFICEKDAFVSRVADHSLGWKKTPFSFEKDLGEKNVSTDLYQVIKKESIQPNRTQRINDILLNIRNRLREINLIDRLFKSAQAEQANLSIANNSSSNNQSALLVNYLDWHGLFCRSTVANQLAPVATQSVVNNP